MIRKILTKEEKEKKTRRNQLIIGIVLILLMVLSTVGYALDGGNNEESENVKYNGIEFQKDSNGYWEFNLQNSIFNTKYNPDELKEINFFSTNTINNYLDKPLYFSGEGNDAFIEINRNLNSLILRVQDACISEKDCLGNLPIKNCSVDNIIIAREPLDGEKESIYQNENCIFIISRPENQAKYADAFLFKILGI